MVFRVPSNATQRNATQRTQADINDVHRDSASCGYHALKNAIIGVLAVSNRKEDEEVRGFFLRGGGGGWRWMAVDGGELTRIAITGADIRLCAAADAIRAALLGSVLSLAGPAPPQGAHHTAHARTAHAEANNHSPQAEKVREKARAQGRKWDVVWEDVNIKHGIMERNYIDYFQKRDNIIRTRSHSPRHLLTEMVPLTMTSLDTTRGDRRRAFRRDIGYVFLAASPIHNYYVLTIRPHTHTHTQHEPRTQIWATSPATRMMCRPLLPWTTAFRCEAALLRPAGIRSRRSS
jgi:hypothetical protein